MRPTKYNKRITIQKPTPVENDIEGWSNDYDNPEWQYSCWASVLPMKGTKRLAYGQTEYLELYEVEMRGRTVPPDVDCRVVYNGGYYQILTLITGDPIQMDIGRTAQ